MAPPAAQHRGLGEALLNFAEARARALGYPGLKVLGNANMPREMGWYERRGYSRLAIQDPRDPHLVHMRKAL